MGARADTEAEGFKSKYSCEESRSTVMLKTCFWKHCVISAVCYWLKHTVSDIEDMSLGRRSVKEFMDLFLNCYTDQEGRNP